MCLYCLRVFLYLFENAEKQSHIQETSPRSQDYPDALHTQSASASVQTGTGTRTPPEIVMQQWDDVY